MIGNAIKFTSDGYVQLTVEIADVPNDDLYTTLLFSIKDTGIGIPIEKQATIFERFSQADNSTTRKYGGTGLGITIASQLVKLMGGDIGLNSEPGRGSLFWFTLPFEISDSPPDSESFTMMESESILDVDRIKSGSINIMVVDDYPVNQSVAKHHLEDSGFVVSIVDNGKTAVKACQKKKFDLVLMDIQMPIMDGFEATRRIRSDSLCSDIPVIGLTGDIHPDTRMKCLKAGMNDMMTKPLKKKELLGFVYKWILKSDQIYRESSDYLVDKGDSTGHNEDIVLDYDTGIKEFGSKEVLEEVISDFLESMKNQIQHMEDALIKKDLEALRRESHTIKGGAGTLLATNLQLAARQLEDYCKDNNIRAVSNALDRVVHEYNRLKICVDNQP